MNTSTPIHKSAPRDVFLYLLAIITLYISVWRFIDLLFDYINVLIPDELVYRDIFSPVRLSIATLIVVFPVYLGVTWFLRKDIIKFPEKREMRVRKWLLNFTLFVAALTIIVDLVTLLYNFLEGELTLQFALKVLVVLIVAGAVFSYYLWDLRRETIATSKPSKILAAATAAVVLGSIVAGFFIIGTPGHQRLVRSDERRVNDLQSIQSNIVHYWQTKEVLPQTLDNLKDNISGFVPPKDPETDAAYDYKIVDADSFELCAIFALSSDEAFKAKDPYLYKTNWEHEKGYFCFKRDIDPELYKIRSDAVAPPLAPLPVP